MRPVRVRPLAGLAALGLLAAVGCANDRSTEDSSDERGPTVSLVRLAFGPAELTVPAGTTVTWRSDEPITHTVTSGEPTGIDATTGLRTGERPDGRFDAELATTGATHTYRFADPGTYRYFCTIHKGMNARVVVT